MAKNQNEKEWQQRGFKNNPLKEFTKQGEEISGIYLGSRTIPSKRKGFKDSIMHSIETGEGVFDFWGCGQLNFLLADVTANTEIKVVYEGTKQVKGFKQPLNQYSVYSR